MSHTDAQTQIHIKNKGNAEGRVDHNRKALYLDLLPSGHALKTPLQINDWKLDTVADIHGAQQKISRFDYHIALVQFAENDKRELEKIHELICQAQNIVWIALIPPDYLSQPSFCRVLYEHFFDFFTLPLPAPPPYLRATMGHAYGISALRRLKDKHDAAMSECQMVGASSVMLKTFRDIRKVANVDAPVLVTGESGTGKELIAQAIHQRSSRSEGPFVAVNCGALPDTLIQAELFGYEKGAFTGASHRKAGRIEAAKGGTLFLDEIGDLPLALQVNLLRFLQEKTIERLGGNESFYVDVRIIAATHNDLEQDIQDGSFREDLFYRLNVLSLHSPRLADRQEDIELLARFFFQKFHTESNPRIKGFSEKALVALNNHKWPGNVREMINRIRRALTMSDNNLINPKDLGLTAPDLATVDFIDTTLENSRAKAEEVAIKNGLIKTHYNISKTARMLDVSRPTLYRLMDKYHLQAH